MSKDKAPVLKTEPEAPEVEAIEAFDPRAPNPSTDEFHAALYEVALFAGRGDRVAAQDALDFALAQRDESDDQPARELCDELRSLVARMAAGR